MQVGLAEGATRQLQKAAKIADLGSSGANPTYTRGNDFARKGFPH